jgi:hypothetical protein
MNEKQLLNIIALSLHLQWLPDSWYLQSVKYQDIN